MKPLPLKKGEGPYTIPHLTTNQETNQLEERHITFNVRPYGEEEGKPTAFLISEHPRNTGGDVSIVTPLIANQLRVSHGYPDVEGLSFYIHYPENVHENGPELYCEAKIQFELGGPRLQSTPVQPDEVAKVIGQENMQEGYLPAPRKPANSLVMKAFESGLADKPEHNQSNEPTIEL